MILIRFFNEIDKKIEKRKKRYFFLLVKVFINFDIIFFYN